MSNHQIIETTRDRKLREDKQREHERDYTDPEKHYVRKHVWVPAANNRLQRVNEREQRRLEYFTLCAEKAIDVHYFYTNNLIGDYDGRGYPTVVFCECDRGQYETLAANLGRTRGFLAYFEDLVLDRSSEKSKEFYSELPFDIYNLDFTGVCFPRGDPPFSRTLNAIVTLIDELGKPEYRGGFNMFFTFRAQRSEENEDAIRELWANLSANRREYGWYNDAFVRNRGDVGTMLRTRYHEFLLCSLPKLIGQFGKQAGFRVTFPHGLYYPRPNCQHPSYYIISFVMTFDWVGEDRRLRRAVRQEIPCQEIVTEAYLRMLQDTVERDILNVGATRFARDEYQREVFDLLEAVENPGH